jgi:SSS family solute:Na+ symporter
VQKLNGLTSMPVLSVFLVALLFRNIDVRAAIAGLMFGVGLYAIFSFVWSPLHYIHMMFITLWSSMAVILAANRWVFGRRATLSSRASVAADA